MNFQKGRWADEPEINLIPLIDVLLVILIFLVVTTTYARFAELQINLPEAQGESAQDIPQLNVNVDASGRYQVNDILLTGDGVDDLATALVGAGGGQQDPVVVISADARATHQSVVRVMDAARRVGFNRVTFVTQTSPAETP